MIIYVWWSCSSTQQLYIYLAFDETFAETKAFLADVSSNIEQPYQMWVQFKVWVTDAWQRIALVLNFTETDLSQ